MSGWLWILSVILMILTNLVVISTVNAKDKHEESPKHEPSKKNRFGRKLVEKFGFAIQEATSGEIETYTTLFGKVEFHPERGLHLHPKYAGIVRAVFKSVGDSVKAGDPLATIEGNLGVQNYQLSASIDGTVLERRIAAGQSVNENVEAFTIGDLSIVLVRLIAYARDIEKIAQGAKTIIENSQKAQYAQSQVSYVSPILDESTRTAQVHAFVENPSLIWRPGQLVIGRVETGKKTAEVVIPANLFDAGSAPTQILYVLEKGVFEKKQITLGNWGANSVEVIAGLKPKQKFINARLAAVDEKLSEAEGDHKD